MFVNNVGLISRPSLISSVISSAVQFLMFLTLVSCGNPEDGISDTSATPTIPTLTPSPTPNSAYYETFGGFYTNSANWPSPILGDAFIENSGETITLGVTPVAYGGVFNYGIGLPGEQSWIVWPGDKMTVTFKFGQIPKGINYIEMGLTPYPVEYQFESVGYCSNYIGDYVGDVIHLYPGTPPQDYSIDLTIPESADPIQFGASIYGTCLNLIALDYVREPEVDLYSIAIKWEPVGLERTKSKVPALWKYSHPLR